MNTNGENENTVYTPLLSHLLKAWEEEEEDEDALVFFNYCYNHFPYPQAETNSSDSVPVDGLATP